MPVPLIATAIGAVASLGGAKMASSAAGKAQKAQQAATDRALAAQTAANQPYMDLGRQAAGRLGALTANAQPYTQQFGGPQGSNGVQAFGSMQGGPQGPQGPPPGSLASMAGGAPSMPQGGQPGMMPPQRQPGPPMGQPGPPQGPQGGQMVTLQAPTGQTMQLPAGSPQVQMLLQRGARQVG